MKGFLSKKPVKIIICLVLVFAAVVAACNGYFASVALKEQKGVAVCDEWNKSQPYSSDYVQNLEVGDKEVKILCLTDIHIRNHGTFAAFLGINFILDGMSRIQLKKLIKNVNPD